MNNLLAETVKFLLANGKDGNDVRWVGVLHSSWLSDINPAAAAKPIPVGAWSDFLAFADFDYDAGYGGNEVQGNLIIVGDDWWLERGEYDGSEWWEFKTLPKKPEATMPMRADDLRERP